MKKIFALLLGLIILLSVVGCNKTQTESRIDTSSDEQITSSNNSSQLVSESETQSSEQEESKAPSTPSLVTQNNSSAVQSNPSSQASAPSAQEEKKDVGLNDPMVKWMGRAVVEDGTVTLDWSGMGFEICVKGGSVKAKIFSLDNGDTNCVWVGVYADGLQIDKIRLQSGTKWYTLIEDLPKDRQTRIKLVKLSEAQQGTAIIHALEADGMLVAPVTKPRRIVWIGDSITAGFGVHAKADDPFTTETQDITATYGYLLSEEFNAEAHFIAASGHGVATSNGGSTTEGLLPKIYSKLRFSSSDTQKYDFNRFPADLIVVNLGTNDVAGGSDSKRLRDGIRAFLGELRRCNPKSSIVWVYGFMIDGKMNDIKQEVENFAAIDKNTYFVKANKISGSGEIGAVGHPSAAAHKRFSKELKNELTGILGW